MARDKKIRKNRKPWAQQEPFVARLKRRGREACSLGTRWLSRAVWQ
jgi:hypothetical protein